MTNQAAGWIIVVVQIDLIRSCSGCFSSREIGNPVSVTYIAANTQRASVLQSAKHNMSTGDAKLAGRQEAQTLKGGTHREEGSSRRRIGSYLISLTHLVIDSLRNLGCVMLT
ncbi:hypothetical protein RRG08_039658 [Elysia crispata]|uniref:Uncharacterized protein n=1 Tax=Elysia crispata TaxID=231223 RepID=A0AAE1CVQ0_9GAST|nr:hypothetical protein RRG08_039658 [Elysia crispata]